VLPEHGGVSGREWRHVPSCSLSGGYETAAPRAIGGLGLLVRLPDLFFLFLFYWIPLHDLGWGRADDLELEKVRIVRLCPIRSSVGVQTRCKDTFDTAEFYRNRKHHHRAWKQVLGASQIDPLTNFFE